MEGRLAASGRVCSDPKTMSKDQRYLPPLFVRFATICFFGIYYLRLKAKNRDPETDLTAKKNIVQVGNGGSGRAIKLLELLQRLKPKNITSR
jgi:hypothetical protein